MKLEKIFAKHISVKGLLSRICKETSITQPRGWGEQIAKLKNGQRANRCFSEGDIFT